MQPPVVSYVRTLFVVTTAVVALVCAFNLVVDPYGIHSVVQIDGVNAFKSRAQQRGWLFKATALERVKPTAVILGNSRAEVGFDPTHPVFARSGGRTVNLALPGTGLGTAGAFLSYAIELRPPRIAVVGLDFVDARITGQPERGAGGVEAERGKSPRHTLVDYLHTLASMGALYDSIGTIRGNRRPDVSAGLTELGFNPMRDYKGLARNEGYYMLFLQRDYENARVYANGPKQVFVQGTRTSPYFETLRALVASCREAGIELHLVIYPYHAHILELFRLTGLWVPFEDWKRQLAAILREEGMRDKSGTPYPLWDFSGYSEYAMEPVPPQGDRTSETRWYWEAGHFKKELGNVMLDTLFSRRGDAPLPRGDFGVNLSAVDVERHLALIRGGRDRYVANHAQDVARMENLARRAVTSREGAAPGTKEE